MRAYAYISLYASFMFDVIQFLYFHVTLFVCRRSLPHNLCPRLRIVCSFYRLFFHYSNYFDWLGCGILWWCNVLLFFVWADKSDCQNPNRSQFDTVEIRNNIHQDNPTSASIPTGLIFLHIYASTDISFLPFGYFTYYMNNCLNSITP